MSAPACASAPAPPWACSTGYPPGSRKPTTKPKYCGPSAACAHTWNTARPRSDRPPHTNVRTADPGRSETSTSDPRTDRLPAAHPPRPGQPGHQHRHAASGSPSTGALRMTGTATLTAAGADITCAVDLVGPEIGRGHV